MATLIGRNAYLGIEGAFFAIAIIVALIRITIRIHTWRRLFVDDIFFFIAVASLVTSAGLFFHVIPEIYAIFTASESVLFLEGPKLLPEIHDVTIECLVTQAFAWTTIFSVKFSFLFYFRTLITKIRSLNVLWWCTLVVLIPVAIIEILSVVIVCPYDGDEVLAHCLSGASWLYRQDVMLYYGVVVDILTDAMLISIPILLLHKTQFKVKQKISVGIVLCLSMVMIAIAMVRGISARVYGTRDEIWTSFWIQLESSISVIMVCMTTFKALFTANKKRSQNKISLGAPRHDENTPSSWKARMLRTRAQLLPDIEAGATMTGMRTMIRQNGRIVPGSFGMSDISERSSMTSADFGVEDIGAWKAKLFS